MLILVASLFITLSQAKQKDLLSFRVDLDEPAETRWQYVLISKKSEIIKSIAGIEQFMSSATRKYLGTALLKSKLFSADTILEMKSAASFLDVDLPTIALLNFANEYFSMCSSFIVQDQSGSIYLARNLDYFLGDLIRELSVQVDFYKDGKLLYKAVTFAGYFGILTGMRPGSFAVSLNQRDLLDSVLFWEAVGALNGSKATGFAIRYALETFTEYEDALKYFIHVPIISGEYICIAGVHDGAVITRNRMYTADLKEIDEDNWFLVQTNYDHWLPQPEDDDRYNPAVERLNGLGQKAVTEASLFELMAKPPTFLPRTLYTVVTNPSTKTWKSALWSDN